MYEALAKENFDSQMLTGRRRRFFVEKIWVSKQRHLKKCCGCGFQSSARRKLKSVSEVSFIYLKVRRSHIVNSRSKTLHS
jgi:hypothetical protein